MMWRIRESCRPAFPFRRLHDEVSRLFDQPEAAPSAPPLNVFETDAHYVVEAELPGVAIADLELVVEGDDQFVLRGERKLPADAEGVSVLRRERVAGPFARAVRFGAPIDADKVEAKLEHGVLRVMLPKRDSAKPRKIVVQSAS